MDDTFPPQHSPIIFFVFSSSFSSLDSLPLPANYKCVPTNEPKRATRESSSGHRVAQLESLSNTTMSFENRRSRPKISPRNRSWHPDNLVLEDWVLVLYVVAEAPEEEFARSLQRSGNTEEEGTAQTSGDFFS